jgi:hypothetical protein
MSKLFLVFLFSSLIFAESRSPRSSDGVSIAEDLPVQAAEKKEKVELGDKTRITSQVLMKNSDWQPTWRPHQQRMALGIEPSSSSFGVLGFNAISLTSWSNYWSGVEYLFGYSKSNDSFTQTTVTSIPNSLAATVSSTATTTHSGTSNPHQALFGMSYREKLHQSDWMQIYWGVLGAVMYSSSASWTTGTRVLTTADITDPDNYSVTETAYGNVTQESGFRFYFGPKIGSEFYLKWFPQLALGFSTGLIGYVGYPVKQVTTTTTQNYSVVDGVSGAPASKSESSTTSYNAGDWTASTVGIGGTTFSFTGQFSIRYIW